MKSWSFIGKNIYDNSDFNLIIPLLGIQDSKHFASLRKVWKRALGPSKETSSNIPRKKEK